jgi:membrane-bound lytic murein transglycosylase B
LDVWTKFQKAIGAIPDLSRQDIISVQRRLTQSGFNPGAVDGILGPATREALRAYQQARKVAVTGELDEGTLESLRINETV